MELVHSVALPDMPNTSAVLFERWRSFATRHAGHHTRWPVEAGQDVGSHMSSEKLIKIVATMVFPSNIKYKKNPKSEFTQV